MADNEATIKFILQDESGGGAPGDGGAGVTPAAGPTRPATTTARQKSADDKAETVIADRVPVVAKQEKTEKVSKESGAKIQGASVAELVKKKAGAGPGIAAQAAGAARAAGIPGAGAVAGIAAAATPVIAVGAAIAAGVTVITKAEDLLNKRAGGRAGLLSGEVAFANARARIRELESDIRTAEVLGPTIARNVEATSRLKAASRRLSENILQPGLDKFAKAKSQVAGVIERATGLSETEQGKAAIDFGTNAAAFVFGGFPGLAYSLYLDTVRDKKIKEQKSYTWILAQQRHLGLDEGFTESIGEGGTTFNTRFPGKNAARIPR